MIPWAGILAFSGDIKLAIGIFVLWCIMSIVRQLIEPRIVSGQIGIHPIFTLIAMYTGFQFLGVWGLLLGPIILIILKNIYGTLIDRGVVKSILERKTWTKGTLLNVQKLGQKGVSPTSKNLDKKECPQRPKNLDEKRQRPVPLS